METNPNQSNTVQSLIACLSSFSIPSENRYIAATNKQYRRSSSTRLTSMVSTAIGKTVSAITVRVRLHIVGLYVRVPQIWVPLFGQSTGA